MNRAAHRPTLAALFLLIAICGGCDRDTQGGANSSINGKPDPRESFQRIIDSFRRTVEDQPVSFVASEGGSRSTMVGTNKVTSEIVPPTTQSDPYKAIVKVTSQSQYSLRRSKNGTEENEHDPNGKSQTKNPLDDQAEKAGFSKAKSNPDHDATKEKNDKAGSKSNQPNEEIVTRRPDVQVRQYELIYENGRWRLVTQLNPKTEKSIQFAFDQALASQ